ncbi:hypothetical protein [Herbiconiux sp. YIM B11900]|uniref:hypothetical protein n=1 Tax=Herbiconiux sp. YIM B11900 TaxID=3404131 RepID=UPI003F846C03
MSSTNWTKTALRARLRADLALDTAAHGRAVTPELAGRRLDYLRIVAGVDRGSLTAEDGASAFELLARSVDAWPAVSSVASSSAPAAVAAVPAAA